ncbi:MAG: dephospho-CoA kinase [Ignavibacteria bacterium GWB2_35_12]|nr:MAG: dephospho-CoA kinase [Ignavibacteria bacterium GWA2_35_8]OGU41740.1 MAG: dephospho-CoA kinase [Ignavibacteria bacterium GWB2_35_12]OGU90577.1 MAG: dephospho-CoA kinase [Ignavibacteria bacterium RIFOXYA2_FULL_35_10]OGV23331.1 MAG: dephospho-CoA kinase [Ignavibacteria bacterium RIFOXYC2_FULL_35_21]
MEVIQEGTLVIGITGGIGCGKTTVSHFISELGYIVISTDEKAKELMVTDFNIKNKIFRAFGSESYNSDGSLNSQYISDLVFGKTDEHTKRLSQLNSIVHPPVIDYMIEEVQKYEEKGEPLVFIESALIYEAELEEGFDYVIVVDSTEENAIQRITQRTGMTEEIARIRMKQQISQQEKKQLADFVIENNGTVDELKQSVKTLMNIVKNLKVIK